MILAAGMWVFTLGYAAVYAGVSWFTHGATAITFGQAIGLGTSLQPVANPAPTTQPSAATSTTLPTQPTQPQPQVQTA